MPRLRDQMSQALASAAAAAVEQGQASQLRPVPPAPKPEKQARPEPASAPVAAPVATLVTADEAPSETPAQALLAKAGRTQPGDLVQFGFRCPRGLKREVERFCFEREVTLQDFGQTALRLLLDELSRPAAG